MSLRAVSFREAILLVACNLLEKVDYFNLVEDYRTTSWVAMTGELCHCEGGGTFPTAAIFYLSGNS
jgi:hypothetical protein